MTEREKEQNLEQAVDSANTETPRAQENVRRQALSAAVFGGLATLLASCGKYVSRFDNVKSIGKKDDGNVAGKIGGGEGNGKTNTTGGGGSGGSGGPGPGITTDGGGGGGGGNPLDPNGDPRPCVDVSSVTAVMPSSPLKFVTPETMAPAMYGSAQSALLAMKFKTTELAVGDLVHIFVLKPADEKMGVLIASRRVLATDVYSDFIGIVFESISFAGFKTLSVVLVRGAASSRFNIDVTNPFRKSVPDGANKLQVFDLNDARVKDTNDKLFGLEYHADAPRCPSNARTDNANLGACEANDGSTFLYGAKKNSTYDVSKMLLTAVATGVRVEDIFGEVIPSADYSTLFNKHQSVVVYRKKEKDITGIGNVSGYLRYFFYVG